ncbi:hypothetical protein AnigIFM62618_011291 [Aspergillus niger]|nr:hypothetical protein AnigIFM62618_011291 [Aspergillus niger]
MDQLPQRCFNQQMTKVSKASKGRIPGPQGFLLIPPSRPRACSPGRDMSVAGPVDPSLPYIPPPLCPPMKPTPVPPTCTHDTLISMQLYTPAHIRSEFRIRKMEVRQQHSDKAHTDQIEDIQTSVDPSVDTTDT